MREKDAFSGYHPVINFLYYALVLLFSMCLMHPVYLLISLTGALTYNIYLKGRKAVRFAVMGLLPMAALAALINPAFNHEGATILTYLPSGNPLTLESILYGAAAAAMLAAVVTWFSCYTAVMTSDKFVYLFGRVIPALSLVLSMALRFIPTLIEETDKIMSAQKARGADFESGNIIQRVKNMVPLLVPLFISAFRRANDLALAMEARCYHGGEGRTQMKPLRYQASDYAAYGVLMAYLVCSIGLRVFGL